MLHVTNRNISSLSKQYTESQKLSVVGYVIHQRSSTNNSYTSCSHVCNEVCCRRSVCIGRPWITLSVVATATSSLNQPLWRRTGCLFFLVFYYQYYYCYVFLTLSVNCYSLSTIIRTKRRYTVYAPSAWRFQTWNHRPVHLTSHKSAGQQIGATQVARGPPSAI